MDFRESQYFKIFSSVYMLGNNVKENSLLEISSSLDTRYRNRSVNDILLMGIELVSWLKYN